MKAGFTCCACLALLCFSCVKPEHIADSSQIVSMRTIDQNGLTESINSKERLVQFQQVDFLKSQPYQKVLRVFGRNQEGLSPSCITSYYPSGEVRQYLEALGTKAFGHYREWHGNGQLKIDAIVVGGVPDLTPTSEKSWVFHGIAKAFDEAGSLLAEIPYFKGDLEGESKYYYPGGTVQSTISFHHNRKEGIEKQFLLNGFLKSLVTYRLGEKDGDAFSMWVEDIVQSEESYSHGLLEEGRYFDRSGKLIGTITRGVGSRAVFDEDRLCRLEEYKNGIQEGVVQLFDEKGRLCGQYSLKRGVKDGEEIVYRENLLTGHNQKTLSIYWRDGLIQGLVRSWYDSGQIESEREMCGNEKNGSLTAWYRSGHLMMKEEYSQDLLTQGEYFRLGDPDPISHIQNGKGIATFFDADGNFLRRVTYDEGKAIF